MPPGFPIDDHLAWRGIPKGFHCKVCEGTGVKTYPNTTTWRYAIGASEATQDVCDECWGSGRRDLPWPSHKELRDIMRAEKIGMNP